MINNITHAKQDLNEILEELKKINLRINRNKIWEI